MLVTTCIGYLGGDAQKKMANGKEFITFRVAHTDKWTDERQKSHETTTWVDCIMNGVPPVFQFLKSGQLVYVTGATSLRIYSSPKDRCMKAGLTINVRSVELLGGKVDGLPSVLFSAVDGHQVDVQKYLYAQSLVRDQSQEEWYPLVTSKMKKYVADRAGWVYPVPDEENGGDSASQSDGTSQSNEATDANGSDAQEATAQ